MMDLTNRYALSLYVDAKLGLLNGRCFDDDHAYELVEETYGSDAANYAVHHAGSRRRAER